MTKWLCQYEVWKSIDGQDWSPVGNITSRSMGEAARTAKRRDGSSCPHWKVKLVANRSGKRLGKVGVFNLLSSAT